MIGQSGVLHLQAMFAFLMPLLSFRRIYPSLLTLHCYVAFVACCGPAFAIDPSEYLSELHHTQWTTREGAPAGINALTQTKDGYLWLATQTGLYRFDGVSFEQYRKADDGQPLTGDVSAVLATDAGALWVGMRFGGAYVIAGDHITHYGKNEGLSDGAIFNFAIRDDETVWAIGTGGLYYRTGSKWFRARDDWGYPEKGYALFAARDGTLWARSSQGTFFLPKGAKRFVKSDKASGSGWIFAGPNGDPWVSDQDVGLIALSGPTRQIGGTKFLTDVDGTGNSAFDRDGGLWTQRYSSKGDWAIVRIPQAGTLLARSDALKPADFQILKDSDSKIEGAIYAMMEDREGNIWTAGLGSLDRFRSNKLHSALEEAPRMASTAMARDGHGSIWLANVSSVIRFGVGHTLPDEIHQITADHEVQALWADLDGGLWLGRYQADMVHFANQALQTIASPAKSKGFGAQSIARDSSGALWISNIADGLFRRDGDTWTGQSIWPALPPKTPIILSADRNGRLWIGYNSDQIAVIEDNHEKMLDAADGLHVGNVLAISQRDERVWIGGTEAVQLYVHNRFWTLARQDGTQFAGVSGVVQDDTGSLWLNGSKGVWRVDSKEISAFVVDHTHSVDAELLNFEDGLRGTANQLHPIPTAIEGGDSRIWFTTNVGAYWIDPTHIHRNAVPPPVYIRSFFADGISYSANNAVLPQRTTNFEVDYTAPSLSIPSRVRFRYRLLGVDKEWQEAGVRRQAYYTNVSPGLHVFQVTAANEDGVWNEAGASTQFIIAPAYYQTRWFYTLCAILVLLALWQLYRLRVHQLARQFQERLGARLEERERIARELHDTLLQSTQGLILLFQGFAGRVRDPEPMRDEMEVALDQADSLLNEARDRVSDLRTTGLELNVEQAITRASEELFADSTTRVAVVTAGTPRPLVVAVADDVYRIAREALTNAYAHAKAQMVEIEIAYEAEQFRLNIRDDGRGLAEDVLQKGSKPNHFGLQGMRERAKRSGGTLNVWSKDGAGTEIALKIPAKTAYAELQKRTRWMPADLF
jgi:signal transduction histidine kinase/ligand-binding sensor domain-containing protein